MTRPVVILAGKHGPHEELLLGVSIISGLSYLIGTPPPTSIAALMPPSVIMIWAVGLLVSGVVGLTGCHWRGVYERGVGLEQSGLLIGAGAMLTYGTAAFALGGWRALLAGAIVVAWAVANVVRTWQLFRHMRELRRS